MGSLLSVLVLAAVAVAVTVIWIKLANRALNGRFAEVNRRLGLRHETDAKGRPIPEQVGGTHRGRRVEIEYRHGGRHSPERLIYRVLTQRPLAVGRIDVRRKNPLDRLAAGLGLTRELWTREHPRSEHVHLAAGDDRYGAGLVRDAGFREAAQGVLDYRRARLRIRPEGIELEQRSAFMRGLLRRLTPRNAERALDMLHRLAEVDYGAVEPVVAARGGDGPMGPPAPLRERPTARTAVLTAGLMMFAGPAMLWMASVYPPLTWDLHLIGFGIGGAMLLAYGGILFRLVRGHSRSLSRFTTLLFLGLVGFPTFAGGLLVAYNGVSDRGEPERVDGRVFRVDHEEHELRLAVTLADGRRGEASLEIPPAAATRALLGETIPLRIKPGALGYPWCAGVAEPEPAE